MSTEGVKEGFDEPWQNDQALQTQLNAANSGETASQDMGTDLSFQNTSQDVSRTTNENINNMVHQIGTHNSINENNGHDIDTNN